jgi:hypothetical protein
VESNKKKNKFKHNTQHTKDTNEDWGKPRVTDKANGVMPKLVSEEQKRVTKKQTKKTRIQKKKKSTGAHQIKQCTTSPQHI